MTRGAPGIIAFMLVAGAAPVLRAQVSEQSVELFGGGGVVGGVTPVSAAGHTYMTPHGGARVDAGIQGELFGFGVATRIWEARRTHGVGTGGIDLLAVGEFRASRDARTIVRVGGGFGFDEVDNSSGTTSLPDAAGNDGLTWSAGVAREVFIPTGDLLQLSVDVIMPPGGATGDGRRAPVLELGIGYRSRFFHRIGLPGRRGGH